MCFTMVHSKINNEKPSVGYSQVWVCVCGVGVCVGGGVCVCVCFYIQSITLPL